MNIGDKVVITKCPDNYGFFSVGDLAVLDYQDSEGDWWAEFSDGVWCIQSGISKCVVVNLGNNRSLSDIKCAPYPWVKDE